MSAPSAQPVVFRKNLPSYHIFTQRRQAAMKVRENSTWLRLCESTFLFSDDMLN